MEQQQGQERRVDPARPDRGPTAYAGSAGSGAGGDRGRTARVLARAIPLARRLAGSVRVLAVAGLLAGAVLWATLVLPALDDLTAGAVLGGVLLLALLAGPGIVLLVFSALLHEVIGLPDRIRQLPQTSREQAAELGALSGDLRRERLGLTGLLAGLWRLGRLLLSGRDTLMVHAPLMALARRSLLILVPGAALLVLLEIVLAAVAVVGLLGRTL